ncbi:Smg-4/UPF3 family-domain-containing protein [Crepidotus variabilis]|uniref:Smg-4/UPF3 family-domain-containing protein n=1 Tax=Crepidotus variabilis TaxID=179855 RepID=A0A9P6E4A8_9AGAR|nr:Smg-4/UPF3 family-domain-containing protein [Crepidotus variabilis]
MTTPIPTKPARVKKEKERRQSQLPTSDRLKVVIRRLPPNLPEEIFWQSVQAWISDETTNWKAYYLGKLRKKLNKENISSRAYIAFKNEELLAVFSREYDGHIFRDKSGLEYQAVVEFAPYPKIPSEKKKPDNRNATIEKDEDFISFLELLKATENAEPVSLDTLIAATQTAPAPKTTPLLEALKAEKSAARDKEAILRNHAHYKQAEIVSRKEDKKKSTNAPSGTPSKAIDSAANRKASKKAHAQQQAQAQAAAAAAVQAAAINPGRSTQTSKGPPPNAAASPSRPPRPPKPPRVSQLSKAVPAAPTSAVPSDAPGPSTSTIAPSAAGSGTTDPAPATRRSRPLIGIASRQFEAALNIAGLANSASERKRREKEREGQPTTPIAGPGAEAAAKDESKSTRQSVASSLSLPTARIDESDNEQEKEPQVSKVPGPSPRKDRSRRGGRGGGHHALEGVSAPPKVLGILQRNDALTPAAPVIHRPTSGTATGSSATGSGIIAPPVLSGGGGPPSRGRRGRGGGRGRGGASGGPRGGG